MQTEAEHEEWVRKFYKGSWVVDGWNDRVKELTSGLDASDATEVKAGLDELGILISHEWAKDNDVRKINTDHLKAWGARLKDEKAKGTSHLQAAIKTIAEEARALLP